MSLDPDVFLRDDIVQGDSGSGAFNPVKSPLRQHLKMIGRLASGNTVHVASRAELYAITGTENQGGYVWADATGAYNGVYRWDADSSPAAWERIAGLPHTAAVLTNVGGTANAITADTETGVDPAEVQLLILPDPSGTIASGGVTLRLNGGAIEPVKSSSGSDPAAGDIIDGVGTVFFRYATEWRQLVSSQTGATMDYQGAWDAGVTYTDAQFVTTGNKLYFLTVASSLNEEPGTTSPDPWLLVVDFSSLSSVTSTGATTARSLSDRFAAHLTPEDFGAAGDGTTDDTAAVQACVDAAGVSGANVSFISMYSVTTVEFNYKNMNVVGLGSDTGLKARSASSVAKTLLADRVISGSMENLRFRDFAIDGNSMATSGFELERFTRGCELRGIYVYDCDGDGVNCYDSWSYGIDNCFVKNCTGWGIHMYGVNAQNNAWTCTNVEVTECGATDGSAGGWRISDAQGGVMTGCISEYNKDQNFWVSGNSLIIEGNYFEGFSATRTVVGDAEYCVTLGSSTESLINSSFRNYVNGGSDGGSGFSGDGVRIRSVIATQIDCTFSASTRKTYVHLETDTFIGNEINLGFDTHGASFKTASITNDTDAVTGGIEVLNGTSVYGNYGRRFGDSFGIRSDYQIENDGTTGSICHWRILYNQTVAFQFGKLASTSDAFQFHAVESGNYYEFIQPAVVAPAMTSTERDALPVKKNGMLILNTTTGVYQAYKETGSTWVNLS